MRTISAMAETLKQLLENQLHAALCTLSTCIDRCPDAAWDGPIVNLAFNQAAFHTLFFTDYYLGREDDVDAFKQQPFHRDHRGFFRDYEELVDRPQVLMYDRPTIQAYVQHCREKATRTIAEETEASLTAPCGFARREFSRAELYVYTTRHIQHHAAQLILRLRRDFDEDIPWFGSGWRDL
jgi:hypothetical protein